MDDWFIMNGTTIIIYTFLSIIFYIVMHHKDVPEKYDKRLPGLAVAIASGFDVGLYFLITVSFYMMGVVVVDAWKKRATQKNLQ